MRQIDSSIKIEIACFNHAFHFSHLFDMPGSAPRPHPGSVAKPWKDRSPVDSTPDMA
jgi:hypothetical protein